MLRRELLSDGPVLVSAGPRARGLSGLSNAAQTPGFPPLLPHKGRGRQSAAVHARAFGGGWGFGGGIVVVVPVVLDILKQTAFLVYSPQ